MARTATVPQAAPHWVFTATFLSFVLVVFVALLAAVGPVMLIVVPIALYALKSGSGSERGRGRTRQA
jgi:hypothetical protein